MCRAHVLWVQPQFCLSPTIDMHNFGREKTQYPSGETTENKTHTPLVFPEYTILMSDFSIDGLVGLG